MRAKVLVLMAVLCVGVTVAGFAEEKEKKKKSKESESGSMEAVTRIEYNALGFMKMEMPREKAEKEEKADCPPPKEKTKKPGRPKEKYKRVRFLNLGVFCLYKQDPLGDGGYRREWFDLPLITTFATEKTEKGGKVEILHAPLVKTFTMKKRGNDSDLQILDVPFATLFERRENNGDVRTKFTEVPFAEVFTRGTTRNGKDHWTFVQVPFVSLAKSAKSRASNEFSLVKMPCASLMEHNCGTSGEAETEILDLPVFGPVLSF